MMETIYVRARAKAFSGEGVRAHQFYILDGQLRVWDSIAGHYTNCHSLSARAIRRILKLARGGR